MEYRLLGGSGLKVSAIGFGAMTFGGTAHFARVGTTRAEEAERIVGRALDGGITFFDTADAYSAGLSEEILGSALGSRRADAILATKVAVRNGAGPNDIGLSRHHIMRSCESSLRRM
ncbi:MAG: aldo/keto reductase, partial [Steroidobacteraceae bacterium]